MTSIDDIQYDINYSQSTFRFLLLYTQYPNHIGPTPVVLLSYASLMTFINTFHNLNQCQQYISNDNTKMITLVISDGKIHEWNNNIQVIDHNIDKIHIFCQNYSNYLAMKKWDGCYKNKVQDVYLPDTFEFNLLKLGVDYIHKVMPEFRPDRQRYRKLHADAVNLIEAMKNYFQDKIDSLDDDLAEEAQ